MAAESTFVLTRAIRNYISRKELTKLGDCVSLWCGNTDFDPRDPYLLACCSDPQNAIKEFTRFVFKELFVPMILKGQLGAADMLLVADAMIKMAGKADLVTMNAEYLTLRNEVKGISEAITSIINEAITGESATELSLGDGLHECLHRFQ